ncbi:MAG: hypothetical protein HY231_17120 [Acidobacteria bacterium]|nr:hypothetical protein [Acidobacteriota bacterium]
MKDEGPQLEILTRRLAECPGEFLVEPRSVKGEGQIEVAAVVFDLLRDLGGKGLPKSEADNFRLRNPQVKDERNHLRLVLIASWLLHDIWFRTRGQLAQSAYELLRDGLREVAKLVDPPKFVSDPDRREELARLCLKGLGLRPAGESIEQAQDRLTTLDSVERVRVVKAAREAEERARLIREEMARKAAEEAAANYGRE